MKKLFIIFLLMSSLSLIAQDKHKVTEKDYANSRVEMADKFREDGKIYVVVVVALVILSGLILYAVKIDRKVTKLEREFQDGIR